MLDWRTGDNAPFSALAVRADVPPEALAAYGEAPKENVGAASISINSQNTGTSAEALFGAISFKRK